jgi:hypothetical protein
MELEILHDAVRSFENRMAKLEEDHKRMTDTYIQMKRAVDDNTTALQEFIELGKGLKFGIKVLGVIEATAVWITKVALAIGTLWAIWKYGVIEALRNVKS